MSVIEACAADRDKQPGTWITDEMMAAYSSLHRDHWAHSVEVWQNGELVGGLYGLAIGRAFFGESMFSRTANASKIAMWALCRHLIEHRFAVLDCQVVSPHLTSLGAIRMPRPQFAALLDQACEPPTRFATWPESRMAVADLLACTAPPALQ